MGGSRIGRKMKLNIGCGMDKRYGFVNLDKNKDVNPDKIADIDNGIPFNNNTFDYIICIQVLEHTKDLYFVMKEIHRVSKSGGIIHIEVPYYNAKGAYTHPDHKRFFTEYTFNHFEGFNIISIKKQRGKYIPWHIHGLKVMLEVK